MPPCLSARGQLNVSELRELATQGATQGKSLDEWIVNQLIKNPKITTKELAELANVGIITIKRHIAKMPRVQYVGRGSSGFWKVK